MARRPRNIYPMDASDPALRWCACGYPFMPAAGCPDHEGTCLTCCAKAGLECAFRQREAAVVTRRQHSEEEAHKITADIEALYGKGGGGWG